MDTRFISNFFRSGLVVSIFFIGFTNTNPVLAAACANNTSTTTNCTGPLNITISNAGTISNAWEITSTGSSGLVYGVYQNTALGGFSNTGTITATATGSGEGLGIYNNGPITTLTNTGSIASTSTGYGRGWGIYNGGTITTLNNSSSITGTSTDSYGFGIYNYGIITTLTNTGSITGTSASGAAFGINNAGTITTLNNAQSTLTYTDVLPTNYNVIITSASNYGKLSGTSVTGSTNFGIYAGATITTKLYTGVLQGLTTSNVGATRTGTYSGFNYTLALQSGSSTIWDLIFTGTADTQPSLAASAYALRGVYNLQTATINNGLNYDCTVFDTHGVCISVGGRYTSTDSPGTNNGNALVVASYNLTDHVRVGGYLDQNISNSTPTGIKLNNGSPLAGLFGVWNEHKSGEGLEVRVAAGYGDKDLTVTRSVIGLSEAGVGKSQLTSQAVSTTISYGTALASNWMVSPYAGVRYTRIKAGRYTEGSSADVIAPLTYDALVQQSTTALAGVRFSGRASPKTLLTMSAGAEQDTNNVGNSYNASGVTGLTPITFNSNIQKTRAVANAGVYYDITNTQRIGLNAMYRQEAFQSTNTVTALVTYQVGL